MSRHSFRVSTGLKDLIGRGLITNEFVAVFELVKNSFDAHANKVILRFGSDSIHIIDDGKGMSRHDIINKWLFVAYSAKRDGTEDVDYRDSIRKGRRDFAGTKGVGRFSCDRLGKSLVLLSKAKNRPTYKLTTDWTKYEVDAQEDFANIQCDLSQLRPGSQENDLLAAETGTVLHITQLRTSWDRQRLVQLKLELAKLINPIEEISPKFSIEIEARKESDADKQESDPVKKINGPVQNKVMDILKQRTTTLSVHFSDEGQRVETELVDRGEMIYQISEPNTFESLYESEFRAEISFLNRSAKVIFARKMGLRSRDFGSIFLFRNGFRVYPIGNETNDFFGLSRRKQQGWSRYLGTRDLIGVVDVKGIKGIDEATSRDQGLILTREARELQKCVLEKCVIRLERYVVDISWKDKLDKDEDTISRMKLDESSALITSLVSRLAATEGVEIIGFNPDLVRIVSQRSDHFKTSMDAMEQLAGKISDPKLTDYIRAVKDSVRELAREKQEADKIQKKAVKRAIRAEKEAEKAKKQVDKERKRNRFLVAASSLDHDTVLNLHHQIIMYSSDVKHHILRLIKKAKKTIDISYNDLLSSLNVISFRNSQILSAAQFATKSGYVHQAVKTRDDIALYIHDYVEHVSPLWKSRGIEVIVSEPLPQFVVEYQPIDIAILIDNLVTNSVKASATRLCLFLSVISSEKRSEQLVVNVADNGDGWAAEIDPLDTVLEKGTTTTSGAGLGLYHVADVVRSLNGSISLSRTGQSKEWSGASISIRIPK
ncbi:MAG: sensor histidine kinase [Rhodothermaceae bacterium]|nr:sensor histidine kinase [Rhodothermaceae bacterium]MXX96780.1 sensor histidine kinase [Rhodothermaceae bacterium]MXZ57477.1 sensor histidine kinase [Rhodothermaceae bacterium]MYB90461.1 sensor histidine kinase [Rhodothermaceae bacterium]MYC04731.1 sensor histidine kinase [Rhodothermaceae bacterium]